MTRVRSLVLALVTLVSCACNATASSADQSTSNPSVNVEGVSSMPLAGLTGASAPKESGAAPRPAPVPASMLAQGEYLCWANGQARLLMNFTVTGAGRYTGFENKPGTFVFDATTERVTFTSGPLQNVMPEGFYARYYMPNGTHTVSFVSARGAEAAFCEKR